MKYIAHAENGKIQYLEDHLSNVAKMVNDVSRGIGNTEYITRAALNHDLGKSTIGWQNWIKKISGYNINIPNSMCNKGNHTLAGTINLITDPSIPAEDAEWLAYVIVGHHIGLLDYSGVNGHDLISELFHNPADPSTLKLDVLDTIDRTIIEIPKLTQRPKILENMKDEYKHLEVSRTLATLLYCDRRDTELAMNPEIAKLRKRNYDTLETLRDRLMAFLDHKTKTAIPTNINKIRAKILQDCIEASEWGSGVFSLSAGMGLGKTLSGMAFALNSAIKNGQDRVIVVIPRTTIITQNANVYRYGTSDESEIDELKKLSKYLFGPINVTEHHCDSNIRDTDFGGYLATQTWDSPIIITTDVQFYESIFAAKTNAKEKFVNIVNSVIILDEAQLAPAENLRAILSCLRGLVEKYNCTILISTATQPTFCGTIGSGCTSIKGLENCKEIIKDPEKLYKQTKRVHYSVYKNNLYARSSWNEIASELSKYRQVLCIVNSRRDCVDLADCMPEGTIQLSRLMCSDEVSKLITKIKQLLKENKPVRVISTSLVEVGVDIDFPVVWRALAQLDSIVQASGRANREGLLNGLGEVVIFRPESKTFGDINIGEQTVLTLAKDCEYFNNLSLKSFKEYFEHFYANVGDLDKSKFQKLLVDGARENKFYFRTFSENFKIIDNRGQKEVFVPYGEGEGLINQLRTEKPTRSLLAKLGKFSVNLPSRTVDTLISSGAIKEVKDCYILAKAYYKPGVGVVVNPN